MRFDIDCRPLREAAGCSEPGLLDGRRVAHALLEQLRGAVEKLAEAGIQPKLVVIRVGEDPASKIYVRHKIRACDKVGVASEHRSLPADLTQAELNEQLDELNAAPDIDGILLQLPLPPQLDAQAAIQRLSPAKDVDGFHPMNLGCLMTSRALLEPCTPRGIMTLFDAYGVECQGKQAVVVGRSVIVGRPMAQMLLRADATVTICHRHTADLERHIRRADILVVATGVPRLIPEDWVRPGAVVADVGMNRSPGGELVGDVDFEGARARADLITPVPRGVGPMTVATLLENTVRACCQRRAASDL